MIGKNFPICLGSLALLVATSRASAQIMDPAYAGAYVISELGAPPGVPPQFGGLTLKYNDPNLLLIGGSANQVNGLIYSVPVIRAGGHIVGYGGPASVYCNGAHNDGGVVFGPGNVLFSGRLADKHAGASTTWKHRYQ